MRGAFLEGFAGLVTAIIPEDIGKPGEEEEADTAAEDKSEEKRNDAFQRWGHDALLRLMDWTNPHIGQEIPPWPSSECPSWTTRRNLVWHLGQVRVTFQEQPEGAAAICRLIKDKGKISSSPTSRALAIFVMVVGLSFPAAPCSIR